MVLINIDGAARGNPGPAGYGIIVRDADGNTLAEAYGYIGEQTNNIAEYTALIAALELAHKNGWPQVTVESDSQLMVKQLTGEYRVKNEILARLFRRVSVLRSRLSSFRIRHVKREKNKDADRLANVAVDTRESSPPDINPFLVRKS